MSEPKITVGELFAGVGGIGKGLEDTGGFVTKWQVECDQYANRVLAKHWNVRRWNDVRTFPPMRHTPVGPCWYRHDREKWEVDLIAGGFPCTDISNAGKRAGIRGSQSGLFYEILRVARILRPQMLLLENVAALLHRGMGTVLGELSQIGYDAEWHCIPAASVGAPHIRDRVFIVGFSNGNGRTPRQQAEQAVGYRGAAVAASRDAGAVSDAIGSGLEGWPLIAGYAKEELATIERASRESRSGWSVEPDVGRVAHGVPSRVDRLRCLGNAVVPQVAEVIGRAILAAETR